MGIFYANTMEETLTAMLNLTGPENQLRLRNVTNGGPSPRRPPMSQMLNCGYCDTICIYTCIRLIFVIGVLANALMIFRVIRDKKLRSPTFIALASLAVADSLYLLFQLVLSVEFIITKMTCGTKIQFIFKHLPGFLAMFWFSASFHVTLLAAMRYIVLVHPIKTLTLLTKKRIIFISVSIWVASGITFGSIMISNEVDEISKEKGARIRIVTWFLTYFSPLVLTAILHIIKLIKVQSANFEHTQLRVSNSQEKNQRSANRMTRVIIFVILAGAVLPLPSFVIEMLKDTCNIYLRNETARAHLQGISKILFLLDFAINPFIYSFNSKTFRSSLRRMTKSSIKSNLGAHEQNTRTTPLGSPKIKSKCSRPTKEIHEVDTQECVVQKEQTDIVDKEPNQRSNSDHSLLDEEKKPVS